MAMVSQNQIQEIRQNADIVEIIKSYIPLTPKGKNFFGVCPFHQDHSPSMSVSKEKQVYKCFSCGAGGNVFQFVKEYENISFLEAVSKVAEKIGMQFTYQSEYKPKEKYQEEYHVMELAKLFFQNNLNSQKGLEAKNYLKERQITESMIQTFGLGFATDEHSLTKFYEKKNIDSSVSEELGLARKSGIQVYDVFQNRVMFPIENPDGLVVGFTGRVYKKGDTPKYLNSKETKLFKKGQVLYNYHRAKESVRLKKQLIMVEGNMDAMRLSDCGFPNTIALMGTSLTKDQIELIRKLRVPILLMLDNDDAGNRNTYQNGLLLEKEHIALQVVRLSNAKDPDEYLLKFGVDAMQEALSHPISFLEFKLNYLKENRNLSDTKELVSYMKDVLNSLDTTDELTKDATLHRLAKEYDFSYELLKKELEETTEKKIVEPPPFTAQPKTQAKMKKYDRCATSILYYMMHGSKYIKMYQNRIGYFSEKTYRQIATEIIYYYEKNKSICLADFLSYAETSPLKEEILQLVESIKDEEPTEDNMEEYLMMMKKMILDEKLNQLKALQRTVVDINEKLNIGMKITELCKEKESIRKERSVQNDKV